MKIVGLNEPEEFFSSSLICVVKCRSFWRSYWQNPTHTFNIRIKSYAKMHDLQKWIAVVRKLSLANRYNLTQKPIKCIRRTREKMKQEYCHFGEDSRDWFAPSKQWTVSQSNDKAKSMLNASESPDESMRYCSFATVVINTLNQCTFPKCFY